MKVIRELADRVVGLVVGEKEAARPTFCPISVSWRRIWGRPMLDIEGSTVRYGRFLAVDDVAMRVEAGELVGLIGANGAGKTPIVKAIADAVQPVRGCLTFVEQDLTAITPIGVFTGAYPSFPRDRDFSAHVRRRELADGWLFRQWSYADSRRHGA